MNDRDVLTVSVEIAARPETVFGFFTDPEAFGRWMGAEQGRATIDPRPGGEIEVEFPAFDQVVRGEVIEIEPPGRFVFTWGYEKDASLPPGSSTVEIILEASDTGSRLILRHSDLPDAEARARHRVGFRLYLSVLAAIAASREYEDGVADTVAAWFDAWSAEDPGAREAALERCLAEDGEFRDSYAALRGRDALAGHIAASRAVMQGVRLEPAGEPELSHRYVRFGWRAVGEPGTVAAGENFGMLDGEGRFRLVVGFRDAAP